MSGAHPQQEFGDSFGVSRQAGRDTHAAEETWASCANSPRSPRASSLWGVDSCAARACRRCAKCTPVHCPGASGRVLASARQPLALAATRLLDAFSETLVKFREGLALYRAFEWQRSGAHRLGTLQSVWRRDGTLAGTVGP